MKRESLNGMRVLQERDTNNWPQVAYTRGLDLSGTFEGAGGIGGLLARSHDFTNCNTTVTYWITNNSGYCIYGLQIWDDDQTYVDNANIQPGETWSYSFPGVAGRTYWIWGYSCDEYYIQAYVDGFDGTLEYYGADFDTNGVVTATQWGEPLCDGGTSGVWLTHNYYHADGNGNITCLVAPNDTVTASYRYDPFGNTLSQSGGLATANTYRFSSKEIHAATGMYYYGYRFYVPSLQRWVNRDPIEELGFALTPRTPRPMGHHLANVYRFAENDSLSNMDSFGLKVHWWGGWDDSDVPLNERGAYNRCMREREGRNYACELGMGIIGGAAAGEVAGSWLGLGSLATAVVGGAGGAITSVWAKWWTTSASDDVCKSIAAGSTPLPGFEDDKPPHLPKQSAPSLIKAEQP